MKTGCGQHNNTAVKKHLKIQGTDIKHLDSRVPFSLAEAGQAWLKNEPLTPSFMGYSWSLG